MVLAVQRVKMDRQRNGHNFCIGLSCKECGTALETVCARFGGVIANLALKNFTRNRNDQYLDEKRTQGLKRKKLNLDIQTSGDTKGKKNVGARSTSVPPLPNFACSCQWMSSTQFCWLSGLPAGARAWVHKSTHSRLKSLSQSHRSFPIAVGQAGFVWPAKDSPDSCHKQSMEA